MDVGAIALPGIEKLPPHDQQGIGRTLGALLAGFNSKNADLLENVYSHDADWVNAFGSVKKGRAEIVPYLRGLFADGNFDAGAMVAPPESSLRALGPDVVVISTHLQIKGQLLVGGEAIALRDNHSLRVLQKQADGQWLVVSEMYMDARTDQTYAQHS